MNLRRSPFPNGYVNSQNFSQLSYPQKFASVKSVNHDGPNFASLSPYNRYNVIGLNSLFVTCRTLSVSTNKSASLTEVKSALINTASFNNSIFIFEYLYIQPSLVTDFKPITEFQARGFNYCVFSTQCVLSFPAPTFIDTFMLIVDSVLMLGSKRFHLLNTPRLNHIPESGLLNYILLQQPICE